MTAETRPKIKRVLNADRYNAALLERAIAVGERLKWSKRIVIETCLEAHLPVLERQADDAKRKYIPPREPIRAKRQ